jgi:hypothetical protein
MMPDTSVKPEADRSSGFDELDRVRLKRAISVEGRDFAPGLTGTIVLRHGHKAYEVEFDAISDVFGIPEDYLEKV